MSYILINKSDSFITLNIRGNEIQIPFGARHSIENSDITDDLRFKASKGMISLIYEDNRPVESKHAKAIIVENNTKETK